MPAPGALATDERAALRAELLRLAWPVVLQNLLYTAMFYVDTWMIARVGEPAVAAMGMVGPIAHTVGSVLLAIGVGTVATTARAWGERDPLKQRGEAATALAAAALVGVPLSAAGAFLLPAMADLFALPGAPEVTEMARGFLAFEGASLAFLCISVAAGGILRATGRTGVPMAAAFAANGANVFLNWVFIYGNLGAPAMGVRGAGLATAAATAVQACLTAGYLFTPGSPIRLGAGSFRAVTREAAARFLRVSLPAAAEPLLMQSGFLIYAKAITLLGQGAVAAHRAAITVESMTFMPGTGFAVAGAAIVGQCLGAGRPDKADFGFRVGARWATYLMSAIGVTFLLFPKTWVDLFLGPGMETVAYSAALCLAIAAVEQPFMALGMTYAGALRGAGDTRSPVLVGVVGIWLIRVPLGWALAFPAGLGIYGIWITMIADWAARAAIFAALWRRGRWKSIKL